MADLDAKTCTPVLAGANYNRFWPMFAGNDEIYFVGDPLPDEKDVKPGSPEVLQSLNNIYKVWLKADAQPVQVTRHTSGNVFYPSLSSDGKVIVYEADFGLWKLDVASGKSTEVKIDITTEEKDNPIETVTIENEADSFDLSPSGKRAVISARNQIFTVATDKGDISTIANDLGASRNESPAWSPDGKRIAFVSDRSGRQEVYLVDPDGRNLKQISDLDTDKTSIVWAPDSKSLVFGSTDKKLYLYQHGGREDPRAHLQHAGPAPGSGVLSGRQVGELFETGRDPPPPRLHHGGERRARAAYRRGRPVLRRGRAPSGPATGGSWRTRSRPARTAAWPRREAGPRSR